MIVAAAVCPHPPLLVPEVAVGAAGELDACRSACARALQAVAGRRADLLVLVGGGPTTTMHASGAVGSLQPFGVPVEAALGRADGSRIPTLPLSLTVGAWLARGWEGPVEGVEVDADAEPSECFRLGAEVAARAERVALLVLADGSARRGPTAPGYTDPRAQPFDASVEQALATGDPRTLATLDPDLATDLLVGGRAALQVLAGAAEPTSWDGQVLYADDPYGVRYVVAVWTPAT